MTISELISFGIKRLKQSSPTPSLDTEILLGKIIGQPKEFIYANPDRIIKNTRIIRRFKKILGKRRNNQPIAYLTNNKEFCGLDLFVDQSVLIPRPETEIIVSEAIEFIEKDRSEKQYTIADVGTGSGCIAISLAKQIPNKIKRVYATDISRSALKTAMINAKRHRVYKKICFLEGSLIKPLSGVKLDILIANLPYLQDNNLKKYYTRCPELAREPNRALFAKENGWYWYRKLIRQLYCRPQKPKLTLLEIAPSLAKNICKEKNTSIKNWLNSDNLRIEIIKDLNGFKRFIKINHN